MIAAFFCYMICGASYVIMLLMLAVLYLSSVIPYGVKLSQEIWIISGDVQTWGGV